MRRNKAESGRLARPFANRFASRNFRPARELLPAPARSAHQPDSTCRPGYAPAIGPEPWHQSQRIAKVERSGPGTNLFRLRVPGVCPRLSLLIFSLVYMKYCRFILRYPVWFRLLTEYFWKPTAFNPSSISPPTLPEKGKSAASRRMSPRWCTIVVIHLQKKEDKRKH